MRPAIVGVLLALAFALATVWLGWWAVPLIGAIWGAFKASGERPGPSTAAAAAAGWALLLLWRATQGPIVELADKVGAILRLPGVGFMALTLAFAALLAGSAAGLAAVARSSFGGSGAVSSR